MGCSQTRPDLKNLNGVACFCNKRVRLAVETFLENLSSLDRDDIFPYSHWLWFFMHEVR